NPVPVWALLRKNANLARGQSFELQFEQRCAICIAMLVTPVRGHPALGIGRPRTIASTRTAEAGGHFRPQFGTRFFGAVGGRGGTVQDRAVVPFQFASVAEVQ